MCSRKRMSAASGGIGILDVYKRQLFADAVLHIDYAANLVVIKCLAGMAQAACAAMDSLHWDQVVGTLAGDDTFVCITKSEEQAISLTAELKKLLRA